MNKLTNSTPITLTLEMIVKIIVVTAAAIIPFTTIWLDVQTLKRNDEEKNKKLERISEQISDLRDDIHRISIDGSTAFHSRPVLSNP